MNTSRFLDGPEFAIMHDHGNEENFFDRVDFKPSQADTINVNLGFTRSWFQTPNSYDAQNATAWTGLVVDNGGLGPNGQVVGSQDQRSQIRTFNIAPTWTRLLNPHTVFTFGGFVRQDQYNYYPSGNPFADLTPDLQLQTVGQNRTLTNLGLRASVSYVKGIHNLKIGANYMDTILTEKDTIGIVDPTTNAPCLNADGSPNTNPSLTNPAGCTGPLQPNPNFIPLLGCYDLTRTGPLPASDGCPNSTSGPTTITATPTSGNWPCSSRTPSPRDLDLQPGLPRRYLRRHHHGQPAGAASRHRLQHQADQHRAAGFLCPHAGNAVQREPGAFQPGMQRSGDQRAHVEHH